ncbi:DNA methylase n-4/n-6 domain-containing protein [endosymbiont of Acanthamoeba sp. UWC8]|uniref:site-specific DNA-methyltransferase n=1 Tax=endosymbiont of Acanthamoeba sp. UWC8 TaxID=86106 RepID=UPI0004D12AE3|nr:site-specific DNA-methyltransferase [endosymbiont of Acanthamoeba sp. UWC8]AIF81429.1 DNA methylase n-4/n-6 domain-containing protein [endosymbiont of Acanthamoeba sp. UWC8]
MNLNVQNIAIEQLIPYAQNARTHSEKQIVQIANSIAEFGFANPILMGGDNIIIAGHGRLLAARKLGLKEVPVIHLKHLNETQHKALVIADNKIAENAAWNEELLKIELEQLSEDNFDINLLGFSDNELNSLLYDFKDIEDEITEETIPEPEEQAISKQGDLWILGNHRLLCGDATCKEDMNNLMKGELADMVFTDPPYNVDYRSKAGSILNDNLGGSFERFLSAACSNMLNLTKGALYICMSSAELHTLQSVFKKCGGRWSTFIIWAKNAFTLGRSNYQRQFEPILYGWKEGNDHYWCGDRNQADVWFYNKPQKNDLHPTMKPLELVIRAIKNSSRIGDIVLDPFGGSGTTLIAAEHINRTARLMELDPKYVDVIIRRWQEMTGKEAILDEVGKAFEEIKKLRIIN